MVIIWEVELCNFELVNSLTISFTLPIFEAFILFLLAINNFLNQVILISFPYVRWTRRTHLTLPISLKGATFFLLQEDSVYLYEWSSSLRRGEGGTYFACYFFLEISDDCSVCFKLVYFIQCRIFFSQKITILFFVHSFSSKVDKDFSIRHYANIFDLWGFKADHKG